MGQLLEGIFNSQGFEPHGYCFLWTRSLLWLYIVSDSLITLSYYSIPIALIYFVRKRRDLAFNWVFLFFAAFIIACGTTHLMAVWTLWTPLYWLDAAVKAVTAITSVVTAVALWPLIPKALALPSPAQLEVVNLALQEEVRERNRAQEALRTAYDEVEGRVRERTRELARTTEALQAEIAERRQGEQRLRLQSAALESAANAIVITDREGYITWVNPAFATLTGYTSEEVLGRNPGLLKSGKHGETFYRHLWETILAGQVWHGEIINRRKDGSLYIEDQTITPIRDKRGDITHFIAIKQDISERQRAEKAQARLVAILEATTDLIGIADVHRDLLYINAGGRKMLGIGKDEDISGFSITDSHPEWARKLVLGQAIPAAIRDGVWSGETALLGRDGREILVSQVILAHKAPEGTVEFLSTIARDITERQRAEATRHALYHASLTIQEALGLQERLNRLLQTAQTVLDLDRVNIFLADPAGKMLQAVASLGVEEPLMEIRVPIGPEGGGLAQAYRTQQAVIWDGHAPLPEPLRLKPPYDQIKGLRSRAFALIPLVVQGRAIGVLGADRTHSHRPLDAATLELLQLFAVQAALAIEQAQLYEERRMAAIQLEARVEDRTRELQAANVHLETASRHKSAFLANMSHELRTPLNGILGFAELLQDPTFGPLNEKQARYLGHIHTSGKHLLALINDLLDLSKVEAGKIELRPEAFVLHEVLATALTEIGPQADAKRLELELHVDESLSTITADPVRFTQIIYNLLSNAVKFTPEGGAVTVSVSSLTSGWVEIAVEDTGIGIEAEDLPKLFQPFTQLESPVIKRQQGTGLGLALTKHLVELHGGQIVAASEGEGRGSTFTVCLPLTPQVGSGVMG